MKRIWFFISLGINIILIGTILLHKDLAPVVPQNVAPSLTTSDELISKYPYISKRVLDENENDLILHFVDLRSQLKTATAPFKDNFAFYFEYLPTGSSIGVNDRTDFNPASLGKVPLAMALYQNVEQHELALNKQIKITAESLDKNSGDLWKRGVGSELTIEQAIAIMLEHSDNTAAMLLADYAKQQDYIDIYSGLDIPFPGDNNNLINAKGYSSILKSLYYAAILNKDDSEKLLQLLTKTVFTDKLRAGVPDNVTIAHKIGFWGQDLYSDCGIVYVPQRPYLLCMFSKADEQTSNTRMKSVSQMIYQYITKVD